VKRSDQADRLLRVLYRSGRLGRLTRNELRMYLFLLFPMGGPPGPRSVRRSELCRALGLPAEEVDRAAFGLERHRMVRITRKARTWSIRPHPAKEWR
jgi:hypothetical protein